MRAQYDVVVVGSGPAGSTAATLLGQAGLSVALLEAHRDPASYKRLCTHTIQAVALPAMRRTGADKAIDAAGGRRNRLAVWSRYGWVQETTADDAALGFNVRRQTLDPLVRTLAAGTPGVDLLLGTKVTDLLRDSTGRVAGVLAHSPDSEPREIRATLVVGADGRSSRVADLAGLPATERPNGRFGYFAYFTGVGMPSGLSSMMWLLDPATAYAFACEDGVTVLAAMPPKSRLPEFDGDRAAALLRMFEGVDSAPDLSRAERVSDVIGTRNYPNVVRSDVVAPGVALIGDAALTGDPLWGVGCGWAFATAEWLGDAVAPALRHGATGPVDAALRRYQRQHRRRIRPHAFLINDYSTGRGFNPMERMLFSGAARDPQVADTFVRFGKRTVSPLAILSPRVAYRSVRARNRDPLPLSG